MAGTRSPSALQVEKNDSSPQQPKSTPKSGIKRKADEQSSPARTKSKRGRPAKKEQKTIEETLQRGEDEGVDEGFDEEMPEGVDEGFDGAMKGVGEEVERGLEEEKENGEAKENADATENGDVNENEHVENGEKNALDNVKADADDAGKTGKHEESVVQPANGDTQEVAVEEDKQREQIQPSNILEKGIVYFFTRGRVGTDDPDSIQDLARSYFVLRPLPAGGKLTEGAIQDVGNNRLIALPKKVWPKSGKDRFMAFVEKASTSMETLKEEFFKGSEYSTKTTGTRHTPDVTPIGEGVYAMTRTGGGQGATHLAYMLTIPSEIGEVQNDIGLKEKGSFVLSAKNPEASAPAGAQLPQMAEYPKEMIDEFDGRGWMPVQPKHLDYNNASFLLIGESDFEASSNLDPAPKDEKSGEKVTPQEELEKLKAEDEHRVDSLKGDDTIFADLGISSKEYPKVLTTW